MNSLLSLRYTLCLILLVGCSEPDLHFEGTFLRADGRAAADQPVLVYNDQRGWEPGDAPDFVVYTDSQGHYQINVPLPSLPIANFLEIVSGSIQMSVQVYGFDESFTRFRNDLLGRHQAWPAEAQVTSSNPVIELSWQPVVDDEDPAVTYLVEVGPWQEKTTATSLSIDTRKTQDFANHALLSAEARVWADNPPSNAGPPIRMSWASSVAFERTSSIPPSRGAPCTRLHNGIQESFNDYLGDCSLTNGTLSDSFPLNTTPFFDCDPDGQGSANREFTIDLGALTTVNAVGLLGLYSPPAIHIQLSSDGVSFATFATVDVVDDPNGPFATRLHSRFVELTLPSLARYVRLKADNCLHGLDEVGIY